MKKLFKFSVDSLNFLRVFLVFFSFFVVLYWVFEIAQLEFIKPVSPFFNGIKDFIHLFYNRTSNLTGNPIDFSFLLASLLMLFLVYFFLYVIDFIKNLEKNYDKIYYGYKTMEEDVFNRMLEKEVYSQEKKESNFVVLIKFSAINLKKDKFYTHESSEGVDDILKRAERDFFIVLNEGYQYDGGQLSDSVFFKFNNYKKVDEILSQINNEIFNLKNRYQTEGFEINYFIGLENYSQEIKLAGKLRKLNSLLKLGIKDEMLAFSSFEKRYSLESDTRYVLEGKGVYKIGENQEDVFTIKQKNQ